MRNTAKFLLILHYLAVLPLAVARICGELIRDGVQYILGRKSGVYWPPTSAATDLLPVVH